MNNKEANSLAQGVRQIQSEKTAIDLVYNEETGEFEQVARGEITEGMVVTDMTKDGFA